MTISEELKAFKRAFWILLIVNLIICFYAMKTEVKLVKQEEQCNSLVEIIENLKEAKCEGN